MKIKFTVICAVMVIVFQSACPLLLKEAKISNTAYAVSEGQEFSNVSEIKDAKTREKSNTKKEGTYDNLRYNVEDGEVTITGYITDPVGAVVIPEIIDGNPVTAVGKGAFYACNKIESISMPSVQIIGENAFYYCEELTNISMPNVRMLTGTAFIGCYSLTSVNISPDNQYYMTENNTLYSKDKRTIVYVYPSGSANGNINIPEYVTAIGEAAFEECYSITGVSMSSVETIGEYAFAYCESLVSAEMPKVQLVGRNAFYACGNLKKLSMPAVETIEREAFDSCNSLTNLSMANVDIIGDYAFENCTGLVSVSMPSVQIIGKSAFSDCYSLESVSIKSAKKIERIAFRSCEKLKKIELANVQSIADSAFLWCMRLESAYFYCDAPAEFGSEVFNLCAENFTIYYAEGTLGWETPTWNGYPTQAFTPGVQAPGDVNSDNNINTADAVYLLKSAAGMLELTSEQMQVADLNHDGKINTADAVVILRYAAGIITTLE